MSLEEHSWEGVSCATRESHVHMDSAKGLSSLTSEDLHSWKGLRIPQHQGQKEAVGSGVPDNHDQQLKVICDAEEGAEDRSAATRRRDGVGQSGLFMRGGAWKMSEEFER